MQKIAIVGAGITGLVAARRLADAGRRPTIFEKSRGPGGRAATRRIEGGTVDHGAPHLNADDDAVLLEDARAVATPGGWIGMPTMSAIGKTLAIGLDIQIKTEIAAIDGPPWTLTDADGARHGPFDAVLVTVPAPQAARITSLDLDAVDFDPAWTLIAAFEGRLDAPDRVADGDVDLALRMSSRPGRRGLEAWAVHMAADWSRDRLESDRTAMIPVLLDAFATVAGELPPTTHAAAHRWRYARTRRALGRPFASDPTGTLLAGGDWALGPDAGDAIRSGQAMADALLRGGAGDG